MSDRQKDPVWFSDTEICSLEQLIDISGLSAPELSDLLDAGVIAPAANTVESPAFLVKYMWTARTARRLRDDFELDRHGLALALILLQRIEALESELKTAQARQPRRLPQEG